MKPQELQTLRHELHWSVDHAAALTGLTVKHWQAMESGTAPVPAAIALLMPLRAAKGTTIEDLQLTPSHLTAFRKSFTLTQSLASALAGTSRVTWNRWENGKAAIPTHLTATLRTVVRELKKLTPEER